MFTITTTEQQVTTKREQRAPRLYHTIALPQYRRRQFSVKRDTQSIESLLYALECGRIHRESKKNYRTPSLFHNITKN